MKYLSIIRYILSGISVVLIGAFMFNSENAMLQDWIMYWGYLLLAIAVLLAFVFPILQIIESPKNAVSSLMGFAAIALVVGVSYAMSSAEPIVTPVTVFDNATELKLSDTGLFATYFIFAASIITIITTEIANAFK